ncbi:MAG TPA: hypothetical protein VGS22_07320 [Thermoanaerobaculia bacterium]|jgi:hypothetical protein|nr:hypothetical protein [Thermoanaerobaculia bacterium]
MTDFELDLGSGLNLKRAEQAIKTLGTQHLQGHSALVNLSRCQHVDVGGGWRLGCALRRFERVGLSVHVPSPGNFAGSWFLNFTRSGLGLSLSRYASEILADGQDITETIRSYYRTPRAHLSAYSSQTPPAWIGQNSILIPDIESGVLFLDDISHFLVSIEPLFQYVKLDVKAYNKEDMAALIRLLFESAQNVWDHADRSPLPETTSITSYISFRYYKKVAVKVDHGTSLEDYLSRYESFLPSSTDVVGFVELNVVDDGVGIAARQSQDHSIYWGDFHHELAMTTLAFTDGISVKLQSHDATVRGKPGFGFGNIKESLEHLVAYAFVRTGRVAAYFDPTSGHREFQLDPRPLGYMPGTVLQVLLPARIARVFSVVE